MSKLRYFVVVSVSAIVCAGIPPIANAESGTASLESSSEAVKTGETLSAVVHSSDYLSSNQRHKEKQNQAQRDTPNGKLREGNILVVNTLSSHVAHQSNHQVTENRRLRSLRNNLVTQKIPVTPLPGFVPVPGKNQVPIPNNLVPNPNPLQFPTRPEEVLIEVTQPLSLREAVELAQRNNRDLQVARLQYEQAQAQLREARAALYPTVDLSALAQGQRTAQQELQLEAARQQAELLGQPFEQDEQGSVSLSGTIEANYNLITGGRRNAQIRAAQEALRSAQLQVEALSEQTRLDVSNAYYDLQLADEQVRIAESAVRNAQQSLRDAIALEQAGLGTRFDTLRAQVQLANQNQLLVTNRAQQQINRRQLAQILSLPQSTGIVAADPVEIAGLWNLTLEESIVRAFQNRAELQQQLTQRNIAEQQRRVALSTRRPQVDLFANYNVLEVFNDGLGLADGYAVGARLRWNLFDGGAARARAAQQEANIEIAETRFANQRNLIRFQVEQAFYSLRGNFQNIQTARLAVTQAAEALRLARLRFQAGVGTQTEVIDAENDLTEAQGNLVRAVIDYNRSLATLTRSVSNIPLPAPSPLSP
ncbi:TolC family protein [Aerosakkonemataceae cyanobacterium BLCC-F154]|uniref:TolC family protein n=1 Tax=Floridaenema fluviatile BLCC-F154 TaxID=3153640 RepID=A0ABV4Y8R2_9CYAN